eukprot:2244997-Prymnesium_polylepis.1
MPVTDCIGMGVERAKAPERLLEERLLVRRLVAVREVLPRIREGAQEARAGDAISPPQLACQVRAGK